VNSFTTLNLASPVPQRAALQLYAMYRPLASRRDANTLLDLPFGGEAGRIEVISPAERQTSGLPEPAVVPWLHIARPQPGSLMSFLRRRFPKFDAPEWSASPCNILYPQCGSGREAVSTALAMPACRISAVDPSAQALAYGTRRALKLGVGNLVFSAGDGMSAAAEPQYHFIDARRGNSTASLAILAGLLLPGGLLRFDVACTERSTKLRSALEFGARNAQGSLQFARRDICRDGDADFDFIKQQQEFYDLTGCFELIAEAERGVSSDELADALTRANLLLIGQFAPPALRAAYRTDHPDDRDIRNLAKYQAFMSQNPKTTSGMFRLLCQIQE